jgi:hypothetical protein
MSRALAGTGGAGQLRVILRTVYRLRQWHGQKVLAGGIANQQIADDIMPVRLQCPQYFGIAPVFRIGWQTQAVSMG